MRKTLSKSIRKNIRMEKARIRRDNLDVKNQEKKIGELYTKMVETYEKKPKEKTAQIAQQAAAPKDTAV